MNPVGWHDVVSSSHVIDNVVSKMSAKACQRWLEQKSMPNSLEIDRRGGILDGCYSSKLAISWIDFWYHDLGIWEILKKDYRFSNDWSILRDNYGHDETYDELFFFLLDHWKNCLFTLMRAQLNFVGQKPQRNYLRFFFQKTTVSTR